MFILELIGEIVGQWIVESIIYRLPVEIYEWITGNETRHSTYRTEQRKFIKFSVAKKFLITWETDLAYLKSRLAEGIELMHEKLTSQDFKFVLLADRTIIQPPPSISFYAFHFLIQSLAEDKVKTVGVVETIRTIYTAYTDPNSEYLIGQTTYSISHMKSFVSIFEIPAEEVARAVDFYQAILDIKIERLEMPGMQMGIFPYEGQMVTGVIIKADGYKPSSDGVTLYLNGGDNLQVVLDEVEKHGGKILVPKTLHADESGYFAIFLDTEGNKLGLHSPN